MVAVIAAEPFGLATRPRRPGAWAGTDVRRGAALQLALDLGAMMSSSVTAVALGGDSADVTLRRLLARGADHAVRLNANSSSLDAEEVVARLAAAVQGASVIVAERQSRDDRFVAPMLAEKLSATFVSRVCAVEGIEDERLIVLRERDGHVQRVSVRVPAVLVPASCVPAPAAPRVSKVLAVEAVPISLREVPGVDSVATRLVTVAAVQRKPTAPTHFQVDNADLEQAARVLAGRLLELLGEEAAS